MRRRVNWRESWRLAHSNVPTLEDPTISGMYEASAKTYRQAIFAFWCWIFGVPASRDKKGAVKKAHSPDC